MGKNRYIRARVTISKFDVRLSETLKVEEHETSYEVFKRWTDSLIANCEFEEVEGCDVQRGVRNTEASDAD